MDDDGEAVRGCRRGQRGSCARSCETRVEETEASKFAVAEEVRRGDVLGCLSLANGHSTDLISLFSAERSISRAAPSRDQISLLALFDAIVAAASDCMDAAGASCIL